MLPPRTERDALSATVDRTSALIDMIGTNEHTPWRFVRCWLLATRFEHHGMDPPDLAAALADFDSLPADTPGRAKLAAVLVVAQLRSSMLGESAQVRRAWRMVEVANRDPAPLPDWPKAAAAVRSLELLRAAMEQDPGFDLRSAISEAEQLLAVVGDTQPQRSMVEMARMGLAQRRGTETNDLGSAGRFVADADALVGQAAPGSRLRSRAEILATLARAHAAAARGDVASLPPVLDEVLAAADQLPPADPLRMQLEKMSAMVRPFLPLLRDGVAKVGADAGPVTPAASTHVAGLLRLAREAGHSPAERAMLLGQAASAELALGADAPEMLDQAVEHFQEAVALAEERDPRRTFYLMTLGTAHLRRLELTGKKADLPAGIAALEQARSAAGSSAHVYWTMSAMPLSHAYRLSGRKDLARQTALSGLRGHAWSTLLQPGLADAHAAARHAAEDAVDVARWCLADGDPAGAATALDAGRGLLLYAATRTRDVEAELAASGQQRLAQQWRQAVAMGGVSEVPFELRREVLGALVGGDLDTDRTAVADRGEGAARLLDPPGQHEVQAALTTLGFDALVYLVPGDGKSGAAVVVPARDVQSWLQLPDLNLGTSPEVDRFMTATARGALDGVRDAGPSAQQTVDDVCDWAWDSAIGPLLERHLHPPAGRPVRLVLVPMRELARVPWHAARRSHGQRHEYAIEHAVFSYAASARLLCDVAWRGGGLLSGSGLFVGDPDTGGVAPALPAARAEALAIRDVFYPEASYVGRMADGGDSPAGPGNHADVLGWLAGAGAGALLHLACHSVVRDGTDPAESSYLLLSGGQHLAAEELVGALEPGAGKDLGLVVLAACSSGRSGRGYDEAFSLGTTFLASRTRTVVSAQWSVPDEATSVLMYMFHHYLQRERLTPVDALYRAQLWMLSEGREPPDAMPAQLRDQLARLGPPDPTTWAAFVHSGR